jgi:hypothetical protein
MHMFQSNNRQRSYVKSDFSIAIIEAPTTLKNTHSETEFLVPSHLYQEATVKKIFFLAKHRYHTDR